MLQARTARLCSLFCSRLVSKDTPATQYAPCDKEVFLVDQHPQRGSLLFPQMGGYQYKLQEMLYHMFPLQTNAKRILRCVWIGSGGGFRCNSSSHPTGQQGGCKLPSSLLSVVRVAAHRRYPPDSFDSYRIKRTACIP